MSNSQFKTVQFLDSKDGTVHTVNIFEVLEAEYGLYTWPCAIVLAKFIIHKKAIINGKAICELGAGTALAGMVSSLCGASSVTLTDHAEKHKTLENCRRVAAASPNVRVCGLTWGHFTLELESLRTNGVDIILAADCFYETKDFEPVLVTVSYLLESNPTSQFWCAYQVRSSDRSFEYLFEKWNLKCSYVALSEFSDDIVVSWGGDTGHSSPTHEVQLLILSSSRVTTGAATT